MGFKSNRNRNHVTCHPHGTNAEMLRSIMCQISFICLQFDLDALVSVNTFSQKSFSLEEGFKYIYLTKINKNDLNETSFFALLLILRFFKNVHKRAVLALCCVGPDGSPNPWKSQVSPCVVCFD